jgi:long-chain acyl-CoA synthetase
MKTQTYDERPWLQHYEQGPVLPNLSYEDKLLPDFLEETVKKFPDHPALNFQGYRITFRQLGDMVNRMAAVYRNFGLKKGDSLAILLPNLIPTVVAQFAAFKIGAVVVMNNPLYSDREIKHQLNDSGAKILVTLDLLANRMIDLMPETRLHQIIYTSIGDYLPFPKNILISPGCQKKKTGCPCKTGG